MKKKMIFGICFISAIFLIFIFIVTNSTDIKKYHSSILQSTIDVPKYSFFINELEGDDTIQLEFIMFDKEVDIVEQLYKLYEINEDNLAQFDFMEWCVNDMKLYKHIVVVYERK